MRRHSVTYLVSAHWLTLVESCQNEQKNFFPQMAKRKHGKQRKSSKKRKTSTTVVVSASNSIPKSVIVTLRYVEHFLSLNPGSGAIARHRFSANGLFDPDFSGGGHQPMGFDQWSAWYIRNGVLSAQIEVSYSVPIGVADVTCYIAQTSLPSDDTINTTLERHAVTSRKCTAAGGPIVLRNRYNLKRTTAGASLTDDHYFGTATGNPDNQEFFEVGVLATDGTDTGAIMATVKITYKCRFYDRQDLGGS